MEWNGTEWQKPHESAAAGCACLCVRRTTIHASMPFFAFADGSNTKRVCVLGRECGCMENEKVADGPSSARVKHGEREENGTATPRVWRGAVIGCRVVRLFVCLFVFVGSVGMVRSKDDECTNGVRALWSEPRNFL
mmetsp:Transcript_16195/g.33281  ORF Transcript_16195/g.33281 Transcript_16195/m.33281 type:complete len:136 (+) Transcript_16195:844-1251(+)